MAQSDIQAKVDAIAAQQLSNQFGTERRMCLALGVETLDAGLFTRTSRQHDDRNVAGAFIGT